MEQPQQLRDDQNNKQATFTNCASFTSCITEINKTHLDNGIDLDIVMPLYNLIDLVINL